MKIISRTPSDFGPAIDQWLVRSTHVDQIFRICVSAPLDPIEAGASVGALYGLDGDLKAGQLIGATRSMLFGGELPPLFAVNIGYPLDTPIPPLVLRNRDLSPWPIAMFDQGSSVRTGGGPAFAAFIAEELKPLIEAEYPVDPGDAALSGVSLAGLFAVWCLVTRPEMFQRYNIISPAAWIDDKRILAEAQAAIAAGLAPRARVYLCAGSLETKAGLQDWLRHVPDLRRAAFAAMMEAAGWPEIACDLPLLHAVLAEASSLDLHMRVFENETHQSVHLPALSQGLRTLYGTLE